MRSVKWVDYDDVGRRHLEGLIYKHCREYNSLYVIYDECNIESEENLTYGIDETNHHIKRESQQIINQ